MFALILGSPVHATVTEDMTAFLGLVSQVVTAILGWVTSVINLVTTTPFLLFTVGFLALGGAIGIFGRLLSRN